MNARRAVLALLLLVAFPALGARRRAVVHPGQPIGMAAVKRILVVVLENEDADAAIDQPYLATLAARGALLRNYRAIAHPSHPNYIAMVAGSTYGITDSSPVTLDVPHLGDLLDAHGLSWIVYAEQYPGGCFLGETFNSGGPGAYVRRHVPFLDFSNVQSNPARCGRIVPAAQFDDDVRSGRLPAFAMYIPDTIHDGHDAPVAAADAWLASRFQPILANAALADGLLFVVVFDEGRPSGPNLVYCSLSGAGIAPGTLSYAPYDHYSLLRTIEEIFALGTLQRNDAAAAVIADVWSR